VPVGVQSAATKRPHFVLHDRGSRSDLIEVQPGSDKRV
jgi:hypothetical protein